MITININNHLSYGLQEKRGLYYVSKRVEREPDDYGPDCLYLHDTGTWHTSTMDEAGRWAGYYNTVNDAIAMLQAIGEEKFEVVK